MDIPSILVKLSGAILLILTLRSIYKHVREKITILKSSQREQVQSISEQILNNILLYLWLAFMLTFSIGMIANN